jgi:peptidoglycan/LPS O-acetylase OafA/YrhL
MRGEVNLSDCGVRKIVDWQRQLKTLRQRKIYGGYLEQRPHRFATLDAMRGIAALNVVIMHLRTGAHPEFVDGLHAPLAVDFFFMLSGFVLTLAYQRRLSAGWPTGAFLRVRLIRLYPLYALGLALGLMAAWRLSMVGHLPASVWCNRIALSILVLPTMTGSGPAFLFNAPSWSLCMELIANVFHGQFLRRGVAVTRVVFALSGAVMVWVLVRVGMVYVGMGANSVLYGIPRVLFSYCFGMLLFHYWERGTMRPKVPPVVLGLVLLASLVVPAIGRAEPWYEAFVIVVVFPWLLLAGASSELAPKYWATANFLGLTSYAVYILHEPLMLIWAPLMNRLGWHGAVMDTAWGVPCLLLVYLVAWLADRFYDGPVRAFLQRKLATERGTRLA